MPARDDLSAWLLTAAERDNDRTRIDQAHPGRTWSEGNHVRPLIDGAAYFAELRRRIDATGEGDLIVFTDWQGEPDQRLTDEPDSEILAVLGRAATRGVDVRGLVWHSPPAALAGDQGDNARFGERLRAAGVEAWLDMRVRPRGCHHQKMVVIRHREDPSRDVAFVGGIDLCHSRRDDSRHRGDPQAYDLAEEYGDTPPWHDVQAHITGPAVHDIETVFRERWEDPAPLHGSPPSWRRLWRRLNRRAEHSDRTPLPAQLPPPPPVSDGTHVIQLLRTYPDLPGKRDYAFAPGGERSVARGYSKAIERAEHLIYVEDQFLWGKHVARIFGAALRRHPELRIIGVVPLHPDLEGVLGRWPQLEGRRRAMHDLLREFPDRVALYGIENEAGVPIYVHAKTCVIDDTWTTIGSDNFNRRSWTHDSELSTVVLDTEGVYPRRLRLTLAAEHLGRNDVDDASMQDCLEPADMFETFAAHADRLDAWWAGDRQGVRPHGRLRRMDVTELNFVQRRVASMPYAWVHDPDGRPRRLRRADEY